MYLNCGLHLFLQVFAIEFVTFAIEFVLFAVEFVAFAVEFVGFAIGFVALAIELGTFALEFLHNNIGSCRKHENKMLHLLHGLVEVQLL